MSIRNAGRPGFGNPRRYSIVIAVAFAVVAGDLCESAGAQEPAASGPTSTESIEALPLAPGDIAAVPVTPGGGFPGAALFNEQPPFLAGVRINRPDGVYREGEKLVVEFSAEREAHLYLLYHQPDGTTRLLFPNRVQSANRLPGGQAVRVPADDEKRFRFRIRPPFGTEVLQVLATVPPIESLDQLAAQSPSAALVPPELLQELATALAGRVHLWTEHRVPIRTLPAENAALIRPAARVGLFIGIGKYQHPEFCSTHIELRHSAEVFHELMLKQGGLDPERTKLIVDEQATRQNMQQLIAGWLPSVSQPGDTVFIYYSGHAGTFESYDPAEPDGQDESLAPYDLNAGTDEMPVEERMQRYRDTSILDDTLARWLEELSGRQVVIILDTCHSGGFAQGKSIQGFLTDEVQRVKDISQLNAVLMTSCSSDEESLFERTQEKLMWFTLCLATAMRDPALSRPLTLEPAFQAACQHLEKMREESGESRTQTPTLTDNALLPVVLVPDAPPRQPSSPE